MNTADLYTACSLGRNWKPFLWRLEGNNSVLSRKSKAVRTAIPSLKLCFRATSNKTVWYCCKNSHKTEEPKLNEHGYSQLVFGKGVKNMHWRKVSFFNKWCWENKTGYLHIKEWNWIPTSYPIAKWKWIKDLNERSLELTLELLRWNVLIYRPRQGSSKKGFRNTRTHSKNP